MATTNNKYTYISFCEDAITLANGGEIKNMTAFIDKANALKATQVSKAEYNKANPKKSAAKGASEGTKANAALIAPILTAEPMTAAEINETLGTEFTPLQVSNACKFIEGVQSKKVIRTAVTYTDDGTELKNDKPYTAYFRA